MKQMLKLCVVIIGVAFLFILSKSGNNEWDDLVYNNTEALASGEGSGTGCYSSGSIDCGGVKVKYKFSGYSIGL
ncbi:MAG: NVEALA domain-containing protein [Tannerellaceae bacterium]|jgi:hypothetical protein|nr:NVEALA domain-containing protein [Tannerellaceae bacterium]